MYYPRRVGGKMATQKTVNVLVDALITSYVDRFLLRAKVAWQAQGGFRGFGMAWNYFGKVDFIDSTEYALLLTTLKTAEHSEVIKRIESNRAYRQAILSRHSWLSISLYVDQTVPRPHCSLQSSDRRYQ
jgi:hypothetical protein